MWAMTSCGETPLRRPAFPMIVATYVNEAFLGAPFSGCDRLTGHRRLRFEVSVYG